jgi:hypothetical protein
VRRWNSFYDAMAKDITAACLFLACKLTDIHIRISEFLAAFSKKSLENDRLRLSQDELEVLRQKTVFNEEYVVVTLCFDLEFQDEFPFFMETSKLLQGEIGSSSASHWASIHSMAVVPQSITQAAWAIYVDR